MTPRSATSSPAAPPAPVLHFVRGNDGRYRAGVYTLGPGRIAGFGIEVMDVFREGVHVHRAASGTPARAFELAEEWARTDAAALGNADKGQQPLI